jgi:SAM-dependent methyltransferase
MATASRRHSGVIVHSKLHAHRRTWESKRAIRLVYEDYHRRLSGYCIAGPTLEVGGGSGSLKSFMPDAISMDILQAPWLDLAADAHALPFARASLSNIVLIDVLHHLARPRLFFAEACRTLIPGGRLVFLEPGITPVSRIFYTLFHAEPVDMRADPLGEAPLHGQGDPYDGNQAIASILVGRRRAEFRTAFPELRYIAVRRISLLAYPLSGGFRPWSLIPAALVRPLLGAERWLEPALGRLCAFRILAAFERA